MGRSSLTKLYILSEKAKNNNKSHICLMAAMDCRNNPTCSLESRTLLRNHPPSSSTIGYNPSQSTIRYNHSHQREMATNHNDTHDADEEMGNVPALPTAASQDTEMSDAALLDLPDTHVYLNVIVQYEQSSTNNSRYVEHVSPVMERRDSLLYESDKPVFENDYH
ncbi:uncharacterized protein BO97DRAFT_474665 [Aspergillus homomorphus CBS 101889]|uniref:Uncharacterized protein n=1 Tax=Aspergillus homomorphus (strain CBS 101889) TaxID=1450537 RepID=A0A395ICI5_ASPHC|nr:hypothetical protein BO97DRAFT_474665 [Aspergillus homomorphus CBS 101889]RAL17766.1 hypothetical protein BO97DRAFT_474665 [Aspergillus homomorphus CBS 101889]